MKCATSPTPPSTGLSGILNTKCIEVIDPEGPEKYNKNEMKQGRLFTAATQHLTPIKIWLKSIPREQPNQNKEMKIADPEVYV